MFLLLLLQERVSEWNGDDDFVVILTTLFSLLDNYAEFLLLIYFLLP